MIKDREKDTVIKRIRALSGNKLLTYSICSVQVKFEDKVTPKYLKCSTLSTSSSNTDRCSGGSAQFAIAADKHGLGLLYVKYKLVLIQPQSYSRHIFIKSILEIFYVRGEAVQNSIVRIKRYATVIDNSRQVIYIKKEK